MSTLNLLFATEYRINDKVSVRIPTVGEVIEQEEAYYSLLSSFTAMPVDMMVQLDDAGIDFEKINEYDLFLLLLPNICDKDTSLILGDLDINRLYPVLNEKTGMIVLEDPVCGPVIDRAIYGQISGVLRKIHRIEKNMRKPANKQARDYMLQRMREKMVRKSRRLNDSELEALIISLVNTEHFHYGYMDTRDLTIYQFNESVRQIINKIEYENRMTGVYAGTVDVKKLNPNDLTWLKQK